MQVPTKKTENATKVVIRLLYIAMAALCSAIAIYDSIQGDHFHAIFLILLVILILEHEV